MSDAQDVVIVDPQGTEHHFPSGFDPAKAAEIVRGSLPYAGTPIPGRSTPVETGAPPDSPVLSGLKGMLQPLAHPQTAGDMAGLLIPSALPTRAMRAMAGSAADSVATAIPGPLKSFPKRLIGTQWQKAVSESKTPTFPIGPDTPPLSPIEATGPMGEPYHLRPGDLKTQQLPPVATAPESGARIAGQPFEIGKGSRDLMALKGMTPIASHAAPALAEDAVSVPNTADAALPPHPLQPARVAQGAQAVGRQQGMSTDAVRSATGPVLGEAPGSASPILPRDASQKIIDKLIQMGPKGAGGPEAARDSYVMRANSDKTRAQIKAYLDALRAVGFTGAAGVTARKALTDGMAPQDPQ